MKDLTVYHLFDTFNKCTISRHRTIEAAVKAKKKFFRRFYRNNSQNSYLPTALMIEQDGEIVPASEEDREHFEYLECCG